MKLKYLLPLLLIITLFLVGCFQPIRDNYVCPDGTVVSDPSLCPTEENDAPERKVVYSQRTEPSQVQESSPEPVEEEPSDEVSMGLDQNIIDLINKGKGITNCKYYFSGEDYSDGGVKYLRSYWASIKYEKTKLEFDNLVPVNKDMSFSDFYLDSKTKEAIAFCPSKAKGCEIITFKGYEVDYDTFQLDYTPVSLLSRIGSDVEKLNEEFYGHRKRKRITIQYSRDDKIERMTIDGYLGIPLKLEVLNVVNDRESIVTKYRFNEIQVGGVKAYHVTLDERFEVVG